MATCTQCGAELKPGTKFCENCGAKVSVPQPAAQPASAPVQPVQPVQPQVNPVMPNPIFTQSFSTGMDTPVAAQPAAPAEEEDDGDYFDDLLSILNKRS